MLSEPGLKDVYLYIYVHGRWITFLGCIYTHCICRKRGFSYLINIVPLLSQKAYYKEKVSNLKKGLSHIFASCLNGD